MIFHYDVDEEKKIASRLYLCMFAFLQGLGTLSSLFPNGVQLIVKFQLSRVERDYVFERESLSLCVKVCICVICVC